MPESSLLPPNATAPERALEAATARLSGVPAPIRDAWDPDVCPVALLPWLAWSLSVDEWDEQWTPEVKRRVIAESVAQHRRKGTVGAVKRAIAALDFGEAELTEGTAAGWAIYEVKFFRRLNTRQGEMALRVLTANAPVRCHLARVDFSSAALLYNDIARFDGEYSFGAYATNG